MPLRKSIRLLLRLILYLSLALLCLLASSRWWLPPALSTVAGFWSVEIAAVERVESGRLRLSGVALELDATAVRIDQAELPFEWVYLQEGFAGEWSSASTVKIRGVRILGGEASPAAEPEAESTFLPQVLQQLSSAIDLAGPWLPRIELEGLEFRDGAQRVVALSSLDYQERRLAARGVQTPLPGVWQAAAEFGPEGMLQVEFSQDIWDLSGTLQVGGDARQVSLDGRIERGDSQLHYEAAFGNSGWMPTTASLNSDGFDLAGLYQPFTDDFSLAALQLEKLQAEWDGQDYRFNASGESLVRAPDQAEQRVVFDLSGQGDANALQLNTAAVDSGWAQLELSDPLTVDFEKLSIDSLVLTPAGAGPDEEIEIAGTVGLETGTLDLTYNGLLGEGWINAMIEEEILAEPLELTDGRIFGPWEAPAVEGSVRTSLRTGATETIALSADLLWDGRQRLTWKSRASCEGAEIEAEAGFSFEEDAYSLQLDVLRWSDPDHPELALESPVQVRWLRSGNSVEERLTVSPLVLEGGAVKVAASYGPSEGMDLILENVSLAPVNRWLANDLPAYHADSIQLQLSDFR
ncbi:MAG TPA: hypothetical protein VJ952_09335, partial [Opitutales bacterium]|nr:hypothetical protein [Opitutales bacterium]